VLTGPVAASGHGLKYVSSRREKETKRGSLMQRSSVGEIGATLDAFPITGLQQSRPGGFIVHSCMPTAVVQFPCTRRRKPSSPARIFHHRSMGGNDCNLCRRDKILMGGITLWLLRLVGTWKGKIEDGLGLRDWMGWRGKLNRSHPTCSGQGCPHVSCLAVFPAGEW